MKLGIRTVSPVKLLCGFPQRDSKVNTSFDLLNKSPSALFVLKKNCFNKVHLELLDFTTSALKLFIMFTASPKDKALQLRPRPI